MTDPGKLWRLGAADLARGYAQGGFTPRDVLEACLARIAAMEPRLNAMAVLDAAGARRAADASGQRWAAGAALSSLDGVPVTVKDNLHAAGLPTRWGSRLLPGRMPESDEKPVARLRAAGALFLGKTNVPEFTMQGYTGNLVTGITRNPWDLLLTPGGSSGGAVAATAAGYAPLALATDGGGSIRRPAAHAGLVGFKPSPGTVARGGGLPEIFLHYEVAGPIGRSAADVAAAMEVLGPCGDPGPMPARMLFVPRFGNNSVDERILGRVRDAALAFEGMGLAVDEAPGFDLAEGVNSLWPSLSAAGLAWMVGQASRWPELGLAPGEVPDTSLLGPAAAAALRDGQGAGAAALFAVLHEVKVLERRLAELFGTCDVLLTPAAAALPWPAEDTHPSVIAGQPVGPRGHAIYTAFANAAGLPAVALPCGLLDGLPVGFQVVGRRGADAELLALAGAYEQAVQHRDQLAIRWSDAAWPARG